MNTRIYIAASLDGFIAREDGNLDWLVTFEDEEAFSRYGEFMNAIDAVVIGRGTFEKVLKFPSWPYRKKVFILSSTMKEPPEKVRENATCVSMKPGELLKYLAGRGFSNIYVDGGKVIQSFLREDCIDEMIITRAPVLLGSGVPLFGTLSKDLPFEHRNTDVFSNGLVQSHYVRKRT